MKAEGLRRNESGRVEMWKWKGGDIKMEGWRHESRRVGEK